MAVHRPDFICFKKNKMAQACQKVLNPHPINDTIAMTTLHFQHPWHIPQKPHTRSKMLWKKMVDILFLIFLQLSLSCFIIGVCQWHLFTLVFAGPVQSGFLPQKRATVDRNQPRTNPDIEGTEPNHLGPVFCGPWCRFRPV